MKLSKKIISFALATALTASFLISSNYSLADEPQNSGNSSNLSAESIIGDYTGNTSDIINDKVQKALESYDIPFDQVNDIKIVQDNIFNRTLYKVELNNATVEIDGDSNIIKIVNMNNNQTESQSLQLSQSQQSLQSTDYIINNLDDLTNIISNIETAANLTDDYVLVYHEIFNNDFYQLVWEKQLPNGIFNQYDSVKVMINRFDGSISNFNRFNSTPNTYDPILTKEQALSDAQSVTSNISNISSITVDLSVYQPNYFWDGAGPDQMATFVRLACKVCVNSNYEIYIDAVTGENLGGSFLKSIVGGDFADSCEGDSPYYSQIAGLALTGMRNLGYYTYEYTGDLSGSTITSFLARSDAYGFYISCHGDASTLSDVIYLPLADWILYPSNISGNWHFVFLDACSTAANTTWANAFKTVGYTSRGFLGWGTDVLFSNSYLFAQQFWPLVGTMTLYNAAVTAANNVPGAGTTPIIYYGDTSYYGTAY